MPRPRIYEEVDKEMKLEELVKMACDLFGPPYDDREKDTLSRRSIREVGRIMHLSEAKTKRLLIEGRWYSTKETRAVRKLMRNGKTDEETAAELGITTHKVRTLKPYKDSRIYGIGTASAQKSRMNILVRQSRLSGFIRATVPVIGSHQKCYATKGSLHE